jgi:predicted ATPase
MQRALADLDQGNQNYALTFYIALLIDATLANGIVQEASRTLDKAFDLIERTEERWWEAEIHRLRGQYLENATDRTHEAEVCYQNALRIAREQGARSLELRAATSLSQLWSHQNRKQDARDLLVPVYDWFTEGFKTESLRAAKALLEELS